MSLPIITLGSTASAQEIWDMFWECWYWLMEDIAVSDCSFGGSLDKSSSSLNLKEQHIRFCPVYGGHNHGGVSATGPSSGHRLVQDSISKVHLDINELPVLWWDYFGEGRLSNAGKKVTLIPMAPALTVTTNFGATTNQSLVPGSNDTDIPTSGSVYDTEWASHSYSSPMWVLFRPGAGGADYAFAELDIALSNGPSYWVYKSGSNYQFKVNNWGAASATEAAHVLFAAEWDWDAS